MRIRKINGTICTEHGCLESNYIYDVSDVTGKNLIKSEFAEEFKGAIDPKKVGNMKTFVYDLPKEEKPSKAGEDKKPDEKPAS